LLQKIKKENKKKNSHALKHHVKKRGEFVQKRNIVFKKPKHSSSAAGKMHAHTEYLCKQAL